MRTYTDEQLSRYFDHIEYRQDVQVRVAEDPLGTLTALQAYHTARVPFESLSLHYSRHRLLSLDLEDVFKKIVDNNRGGYCFEVNTFFATVLRSLGFTLFSTGGRVRAPDGSGYSGLDHMVNIVTINGQRYLVDVGFGANGPPHPVPLEDGHEFDGIAPMRGRLQYRNLEEHTDPNQRVWVYSAQENENMPWIDRYHFVEIEFLPGDFEVMNLRTMTTPQSFFVQSVTCMRVILDVHQGQPIGLLILHRDYVKQRIRDRSDIIEQLESEEQRVKALETYFGIVLSPVERRAIKGLASELRSKLGHA